MWRYGAKLTVEKVFRIDIRDLKKRGYLDGNYYGVSVRDDKNNSIWFSISTDPDDEFLGGRFIRFTYSVTDENGKVQHYDYKIPLSTTRCHFGGVRYWFRCYANLRHCCGRRVATIFIVPGVNIFACRHCYDLSYNSRNKNRREAFYPLIEKSRLERERNKIVLGKGNKFIYAGFPTRKYERVRKMNLKIEAYSKTPLSYPNWFLKGLK